ncbi:hypothetical protein QBC38DRAFT_522017 [Podospora fimiseda]|uniref:Uncharacterized protein n=1 Tax=Podospora fimiseda TaxID=252190 RepID=A0AAN6YN19_9PEZI|nr:hypothetical protein QBC38DRAFT_522017 [Podospora fimiseda]
MSSPPASSFPQFSKLPQELQDLVWDLLAPTKSREPCVFYFEAHSMVTKFKKDVPQTTFKLFPEITKVCYKVKAEQDLFFVEHHPISEPSDIFWGDFANTCKQWYDVPEQEWDDEAWETPTSMVHSVARQVAIRWNPTEMEQTKWKRFMPGLVHTFPRLETLYLVDFAIKLTREDIFAFPEKRWLDGTGGAYILMPEPRYRIIMHDSYDSRRMDSDPQTRYPQDQYPTAVIFRVGDEKLIRRFVAPPVEHKSCPREIRVLAYYNLNDKRQETDNKVEIPVQKGEFL